MSSTIGAFSDTKILFAPKKSLLVINPYPLMDPTYDILLFFLKFDRYMSYRNYWKCTLKMQAYPSLCLSLFISLNKQKAWHHVSGRTEWWAMWLSTCSCLPCYTELWFFVSCVLRGTRSTPARKELQPPAAAKKQRRAAFPGCKGGERQGVQDHSLRFWILEHQKQPMQSLLSCRVS